MKTETSDPFKYMSLTGTTGTLTHRSKGKTGWSTNLATNNEGQWRNQAILLSASENELEEVNGHEREQPPSNDVEEQMVSEIVDFTAPFAVATRDSSIPCTHSSRCH